MDYAVEGDLLHEGDILILGMENARNPNIHFCLDCNNPQSQEGVKINFFPCHGQGGNQNFQFTKINEIR